jgi:hypothetical protein
MALTDGQRLPGFGGVVLRVAPTSTAVTVDRVALSEVVLGRGSANSCPRYWVTDHRGQPPQEQPRGFSMWEFVSLPPFSEYADW